jgi:hypothetical protein
VFAKVLRILVGGHSLETSSFVLSTPQLSFMLLEDSIVKGLDG